MTYPIDVVFIDRDWHVIRVARLRPFAIRSCAGAAAVLELRAGETARLSITCGTRIEEL